MDKGKKVLLGVTGSIAAFKAAALTSALIKEGSQVKVVMTKEAACFITPLTFQTLSGNPEIDPLGGRFDIGPEMTIPKHPVLWMGK